MPRTKGKRKSRDEEEDKEEEEVEVEDKDQEEEKEEKKSASNKRSRSSSRSKSSPKKKRKIEKDEEKDDKEKDDEEKDEGEKSEKKSKTKASTAKKGDPYALHKSVSLPDGWSWIDDSLLYWEAPNILKTSNKIAAFDFDGTLADTSLFKKGADAWDLLYENIPSHLKELHDSGYKLVIFTNQSDIGKAVKTDSITKAVNERIGRLNAFVKRVDLPFQIYVAAAKAKAEDSYRKPALGMWTTFTSKGNGGTDIDEKASFYVGDAAGRKSSKLRKKADHSDVDLEFARGNNLQFFTEDTFFPTNHTLKLLLKNAATTSNSASSDE